jgi:RNA polymerase sigma-70 factor (ECF subfamily)
LQTGRKKRGKNAETPQALIRREFVDWHRALSYTQGVHFASHSAPFRAQGADMQPARDASQFLPAAGEGSGEALGQALEACRGYLLHVANHGLDANLRAKGGASDLVQETFFEAQRDFGDFHGSSEHELLAWLRQFLLQNVANLSRRYRGTEKRSVGREVELEGVQLAAVGRMELAAEMRTPSTEVIAREES